MTGSGDGPDFEVVLASTLHDVKNALGTLIGAVDELGAKVEGRLPEVQGDLHQVQAEARRLNNDLVQLLTLYRMGRGEFAVHPREVMVGDLLEEAAGELEAVFRSGGVDMTLECDPELGWVLDDNLLLGVLRNALSNLVRHARARVRLSAEVEAGWLVIRVEDDGEGYPAAVLEMAGAGGVDFRSSRTGLGLYFATRVMRGHVHDGRRGHIELANGGALGGGVFSIHVP